MYRLEYHWPILNTIKSSSIHIPLNGIPSTIRNTIEEYHSMIGLSMIFRMIFNVVVPLETIQNNIDIHRIAHR